MRIKTFASLPLLLCFASGWLLSTVNGGYPGPEYLRPRVHYAPPCANLPGGASSRDIATALTLADEDYAHNVWQPW